jgi:protocatechuate 3,4-dioxygenase beta subunit
MTGLVRIAFVAVIFAQTLPAAAQIVFPGQGAPPGPRTAMVVGQVVDGTTGAPVPEAIVRLSMPAYDQRLPTSQRGRVMADAEGRFFFTELPAGEFWLMAEKEGHVSGAYRQRGPTRRGERLPLREGERRADVTLKIWKYAVIAGTVVDEAGEPVVGVAVRALVRRIISGRPQYGTEPYLVPSALTDDRGMFRLPQVEPGTYVVVAPSTHTTVPVSIMTGMDNYALRSQLARAGVSMDPPASGAPPLANHRTQQLGDVTLFTMNGVLIPPPASAAGRMEVYRTTYFPAAASPAAATPIPIEAGDERTDLAIALSPAPAVRVSGRLVAPDGSAPPPMAIRLVGDAMRDVVTRSLGSAPAEVGFETATAMSDAGGRFTLLGVPPGEYVLTHANPFLIADVRNGMPAYWIAQRVTVGDSDLTDLTIDVRPALRVEGRLEFRGWSGPQPLPPTFGITSVMLEAASGAPEGVAVRADRQTLEFATVAPGGRYVVRAAESGGWVAHAITIDGKEVTDRAFDLQSDAGSIVISYTDRPSRVTGTVRDAAGHASATAIVLAFPVDRQRWTDHGRSPRLLRSVFTTESGVYTFDHLPPGGYYAIAIEDPGSDDWRDAQTLATLANRAMKLTVVAGEPRTLDLPLRAIR